MRYLPLLIFTALLFLIFKSANLGLRLSDGNIYFYTGYLLAHGKSLYHDIFFTNFPLFAYISAFYALFNNPSLFYISAAGETVVCSILIYCIVIKQYKNEILGLFSAVLYLFSFIILTTSDHQTGVFIASVFALSSYLAYLYKKTFISGIFLGLALTAKAYFLPVLIGILLYLLITDKKRFLSTLLGTTISVFCVILPTLLTHPYDLYRDVFMYSLTRSQGIDKIGILFFFVKHDFLLVCGLISGFVFYKKNFL
jgi:4-amino-4-deoxy-L-arabinose transferase-like glycosyltransferase